MARSTEAYVWIRSKGLVDRGKKRCGENLQWRRSQKFTRKSTPLQQRKLHWIPFLAHVDGDCVVWERSHHKQDKSASLIPVGLLPPPPSFVSMISNPIRVEETVPAIGVYASFSLRRNLLFLETQAPPFRPVAHQRSNMTSEWIPPPLPLQ